MKPEGAKAIGKARRNVYNAGSRQSCSTPDERIVTSRVAGELASPRRLSDMKTARMKENRKFFRLSLVVGLGNQSGNPGCFRTQSGRKSPE